MNRRLQIAIQKSGRLTEHSLDLLSTCGLKYTRSRDQLLYFGENMPIDLLLVRDDDIPELVSDGTCDLGIAGQNVTAEKRYASKEFAASEVLALDFGHCKLMTAGPRDEIGPRLGKADYICDLVSSGATLQANQLEAWDVVLESEAALLVHDAERDAESQELIDKLIQRVRGVLQVKESKYIMLHAPRENLEAVTSLLPGSEFPTVLPIEQVDDKVVVHAVCRETVFWETLESLKAAGASSILVLPVEKMLA